MMTIDIVVQESPSNGKIQTEFVTQNHYGRLHRFDFQDAYSLSPSTFGVSPFLSMLKQQDEISLPTEMLNQISTLATTLNISNEIKSNIENLALKLYIKNGDTPIKNFANWRGRTFIICHKKRRIQKHSV
jgi:hypothetical protein